MGITINLATEILYRVANHLPERQRFIDIVNNREHLLIVSKDKITKYFFYFLYNYIKLI